MGQAQLNNSPACVVPDSEAEKDDGRVAVRLNPGGRLLRVRPEHLTVSANQIFASMGVDDEDSCHG
eukprot:2286702-Karenia_brevis.AAC.1